MTAVACPSNGQVSDNADDDLNASSTGLVISHSCAYTCTYHHVEKLPCFANRRSIEQVLSISSVMLCLPWRSRRTTFSAETLRCFGMLSRSSWTPMIDHAALAEIAGVCRLVDFGEGELIYRECGDVDMVYLISEGRVQLYKEPPLPISVATTKNQVKPSHITRRTVLNRLLRPSQVSLVRVEKQIELQVQTEGWFGQCAALGLTTRQCSARALKRSQCLQLSWSALRRCLISHAVDVDVLSHLLGRSIMNELCHASFLHGLTTPASFSSLYSLSITSPPPAQCCVRRGTDDSIWPVTLLLYQRLSHNASEELHRIRNVDSQHPRGSILR